MSVLGLQRKWNFHGPLTWNLGCWADHEVSRWISNLLVSNRGWQAHHSLLSLLPSRRLAFPTACEFPVPSSWKGASSWRYHIVSANFLLQIEPGKNNPTCRLLFPEGGSLSRILWISFPRLLEKHLLMFLSEGQLSLGLGYCGVVPISKGKVQPCAHIPCVPFAL